MGYFAFICGLLFAIYFFTKTEVTNRIGIYIVFYKYRDKKKYYSLFDTFKHPQAIVMLEHQGVVPEYSDYRKFLKKFRPKAYEESIELYEMIAHDVILKYIPVFILSSLLFMSSWYLFSAGVLIAGIFIILSLWMYDNSLFNFYKNKIIIITLSHFFVETRWPKKSDRPSSTY